MKFDSNLSASSWQSQRESILESKGGKTLLKLFSSKWPLQINIKKLIGKRKKKRGKNININFIMTWQMIKKGCFFFPKMSSISQYFELYPSKSWILLTMTSLLTYGHQWGKYDYPFATKRYCVRFDFGCRLAKVMSQFKKSFMLINRPFYSCLLSGRGLWMKLRLELTLVLIETSLLFLCKFILLSIRTAFLTVYTVWQRFVHHCFW